jgi:hypothetical protein
MEFIGMPDAISERHVDLNGEQWLTEMPFRVASEHHLERCDSYNNDNTAIRDWKKKTSNSRCM